MYSLPCSVYLADCEPSASVTALNPSTTLPRGTTTISQRLSNRRSMLSMCRLDTTPDIGPRSPCFHPHPFCSSDRSPTPQLEQGADCRRSHDPTPCHGHQGGLVSKLACGVKVHPNFCILRFHGLAYGSLLAMNLWCVFICLPVQAASG